VGVVTLFAVVALCVLLSNDAASPSGATAPAVTGPPLRAMQATFVAIASEGTVSSPNGCGGVPVDVQFQSEVTGGVAPFAYVWSFGDGSPFSSQPNPDHAYAGYGRYNITLEVTDSVGAVASSNLSIALLPPPCAPHANLLSTAPDSLLIGVTPVAVLASALGFGLYFCRTRRMK
jgi:PKD domain